MEKINSDTKNNKILSNYKIIKELGHGMIGTVYLIEHIDEKNKKNKKNQKDHWALKIEHIEKKDLKPSAKSEVWRELAFYKNVGSKYPNQFVKLIEYDFVDKCEHVQKYSFDLELFDKPTQNKLKKKASSTYCIRKVFDLIGGNLTEIIEKLELKQIYSMIIQIAYSIKILHQHDYIHGDLHSGNIGWVKTDKKYIGLNEFGLGLKINTFGYIFKLIDFDLVLSKSDIANKREEKRYNELFDTELANLKYFLVDRKFWDWFDKQKLNFDLEKTHGLIAKTDEFKIIEKFTTNPNDQVFLYDILFQKQFQKILCGNQHGNHYKKTILRKLLVPVQDILVMVKISHNPDLIIKYFYDKIIKN
jgi:serine/threonine protein kinase